MIQLTYQHIEDALRALINQERDLVREFADSTDSYAEAEVGFKQAYAKARVSARHKFRLEGIRFNEGMVEDDAQIECEEEFKVYTLAKTKREAMKQSLGSVRARMDAMRSLMASHRELADVTL